MIANGMVLVTTKDRAAHLKDLLAALPARLTAIDDTKGTPS